MNKPALLRVENAGYKPAKGGRSLLQGISFAVQPGDRVAIVGPSGAGKSTLLRLLNRLSELSEGKIDLENREIRQIPVLHLRQQVVLVPQESRLLGMTVQAALQYPLKLRGLDAQTTQQRLLTWTERLNIPSDWMDRTEVQLSVGQRQLVAIARALVCQPKLLLLDEPTSALDAGRADRLMEVLRAIAQEDAIPILMVNHQLELAQRFGDRVLYLKHGRLVMDSLTQQTDWEALQQDLVETEKQEAASWE